MNKEPYHVSVSYLVSHLVNILRSLLLTVPAVNPPTHPPLAVSLTPYCLCILVTIVKRYHAKASLVCPVPYRSVWMTWPRDGRDPSRISIVLPY